MGPEAKAERVVLAPIPVYIEAIRVWEDVIVPVGRLVGRNDPIAGSNRHTTNLDVFFSHALDGQRRAGVKTAQLLNKSRRQGRVSLQLGELGGVLGEGYDSL